MKTTMIFLSLISILNVAYSQLKTTDFLELDGTHWEGELMYINYSDGREVHLPTTMSIKVVGKKITLKTTYPNEPSANGSSTIKINKNGSYFGKEEVIERAKDTSRLLFTTKYRGKDNNKAAIIYKYYEIGTDTFQITKKVEYLKSKTTLIRNKYTYTKKED